MNVNVNTAVNNETDEKLKKRIELISGFLKERKRMPSYSEMSLLFGLSSKNAVFKIVNKLQSLGIISRDGKRRIIFNNPTLPPSGISIKLLGSVEAGFPSPAEEELLDMISIDALLIKNPASSFLLKVTGDSMTGAGIMQGDYVIVDKSGTAKEGDIVIAQVDNAWTMKYLSKENGSYVLLPANPKYKPIRPKNELQIAGVVTGVARKYK
ncbi:MAG: transcriptional repressor LexA [bacterium]